MIFREISIILIHINMKAKSWFLGGHLLKSSVHLLKADADIKSFKLRDMLNASQKLTLRQCMSSIKYLQYNALLIHTGLDFIPFSIDFPFFLPLTKSKCIIFSYFLKGGLTNKCITFFSSFITPFKRVFFVFCKISFSFHILHWLKKKTTQQTCYINLRSWKQALRSTELWRRFIFP